MTLVIKAWIRRSLEFNMASKMTYIGSVFELFEMSIVQATASVSHPVSQYINILTLIRQPGSTHRTQVARWNRTLSGMFTYEAKSNITS
jgi:uncharacterized membrane protein YidH (DUF202 family)